jgi:methyl-accepting chemotaxis protein
MHVLSRLRLRTKLAILTGLSALALVASIGIASSVLHQRMFDDRVDKLHSVVDTALGLAQSLERQVATHELTREQAIGEFRNAAHSIRFDNGVGYIVAQTLDNVFVVHGANPDLENKPSAAAASDGRLLTDIIREALSKTDRGFVSYKFTKPGETTPEPKVAYVARFAPWNLVFLAGAYTSDLDATFHAALLNLVASGGGILVLALLVAWLVNRDIGGSLARLKAAMERLAGGELNTEVPGTERRDEVGAMAGAVLVFKASMVKTVQLTAEQEQERERAAAVKRKALLEMAETIETEAKVALGDIGERTSVMSKAADEMTASAKRTGASAGGAADAAAQALATAQTVASAAEELTASIHEIGGQVNQSSAVVGRAVKPAAQRAIPSAR